MSEGESRVLLVEMPDGTPVWARISDPEGLTASSDEMVYSDTGAGEAIQARVESLQGVMTSVARSVRDGLRSVRPDQVSVEFGVELSAKSGRIVGMIADGGAKSSLKITLTWGSVGASHAATADEASSSGQMPAGDPA